MRKFGTVLFSLILAFSVGRSQKLFNGPGSFSDNTKWNGNSLPVAGDDLSIKGTCTFDAAANNLPYGYLSLGQGSAAGTFEWPVGGTNTINVTDVHAVTAGCQLDMTNGGTLQIRTSWNATDMTFTPGSGTVHWNVTSAASALPAGVAVYNNLNVDVGTNTAALGAATSITGTLTLTSGKLSLGSYNLTAAAVSGGSATSYVATTGAGGLIRNVGASGVMFPVGPAASYNPVTMNNSGTADDFTVSVQTTFDNPPNSNARVDRQWTITEGTNGGSNATITLQWNSGDENAGFTRTNPIFIGRWNGSQWVDAPAGYTDLGGGVYTASAGGVTAFSPFGVGNNNALPVQLASFNAMATGENKITLNWSTASEKNNYGFEVQKSATDQSHYQTIPGSFQAGQGTTLQPQQYSYTDESATPGVWYYRLKQMDLDGAVHYSEGVRVSVVTEVEETAPAKFALLQNYPNPFNPETQITFTVESAARTTLRVYNLLGQEVAALFDAPAEPGRYYRVRFGGAGLPSGTYIYRLESGRKIATMRMVLLR